MKIFSFFWFYFYIGIITCSDQIHCGRFPPNQNYDNVEATLYIVNAMRCDIENLRDDQPNPELIAQVICIFIEMYQKVVEATVTYYLLPHVPNQLSLHDIIVKIIADDTVRLITLLGNEFIKFIFDHQMTWQEKIYHVIWVISVILIIKIGIEKMPNDVNPSEKIDEIIKKNNEKALWHKANIDVLH